MTASLTRQAGRGALWQVLCGGWQALVRLGASTVLARVLAPSDFGLFGMAMLTMEFVEYLGSLGMTGGVIAKKDVGEKELSTCFWTMAGVKVVLFLIAFLGAPLAAALMREPRLTAVLRIVSCNFLITIIGVVGTAILSKRLDFGKISAVTAVATVLESGLAVYLATRTSLGYWALVYAMMIASVVINVATCSLAGWLPRFLFDRESFRYQFRFGINNLGFSLMSYLHQNLDYLLVGRMMGTTALGLYEYAYRIPHIVLDRVARPAGAVVFPALATVKEDDRALIQGYLHTVRYVTLLAFPMLGGLAAVAQPLVLTLWGEKWLSIVQPMQILCLCAALRCCAQPVSAIFLCKDRPDIPFKQSMIACAATACFVLVGAWLWGVVGVALGMLFSTFAYAYALVLAFRLTGSSISLLGRALLPSGVATVVSSAAAYACYLAGEGVLGHYLVLAASVAVGVAGYLASYYLAFRREMLEVVSSFKTIVLGSS